MQISRTIGKAAALDLIRSRGQQLRVAISPARGTIGDELAEPVQLSEHLHTHLAARPRV